MSRKVIIFLLVVIFIFLIINLFSETFIQLKTLDSFSYLENKLVGYCPTMENYALILKEDNNYSIKKYDSAKEVLVALNKKEVYFGLIGRIAKEYEINEHIDYLTIKSGYTLISKNKKVIDFSNIDKYEIYTYISEDIISEKFNYLNINYFKKENILDKLNKGNIILISWQDWQDDFELFVVNNGFLKEKDFRGTFLYSYK